jgi:hypothetical protein
VHHACGHLLVLQEALLGLVNLISECIRGIHVVLLSLSDVFSSLLFLVNACFLLDSEGISQIRSVFVFSHFKFSLSDN